MEIADWQRQIALKNLVETPLISKEEAQRILQWTSVVLAILPNILL